MSKAFVSVFSCFLYFNIMFPGQNMESLNYNDWRRIRILAKLICVVCYKLNESVVYDWAILPCDHLVCIACFKARAEDLKNLYKCAYGHTFNGLSAFKYLRQNSPLAFTATEELTSYLFTIC